MPRRQSKFLFACARLTRETTNRNPKTDSTLRFRPLEGSGLEATLSNPAPGIMIHAEIEFEDGSSSVMKMIASENSELLLLP